MRAYRKIQRMAVRLAAHIRRMGWAAKAYGDSRCSDILQIPLAVRAGLGELGKHGSMISNEYGSNFRLASVLTDLPLVLDAPVDIGVDDLCLSCQRCVLDCPPDAIFDQKQMVRGETKWYVEFDKCVPYFTKTFGCAICIEVCPWSEPGTWSGSLAELLEKTQPQVRLGCPILGRWNRECETGRRLSPGGPFAARRLTATAVGYFDILHSLA